MWKAIETVVVIFLGLLGVAAAKETEESTTGQGATMMGRSQHQVGEGHAAARFPSP